METKLVSLTYEVELQTGDENHLISPYSLDSPAKGRWLITITPLTSRLVSQNPVR